MTLTEVGMHLMGLLQLSDHLVQKLPNWRANDALAHVEQRKFKYSGFVPVRHLLRHVFLQVYPEMHATITHQYPHSNLFHLIDRAQ